jgi:hypothetical protein
MMTGVLAVLSITWAGIQLIMSVGDEEKMKKSRKTIIYSFIGVILSGLAYGIVTLLTNIRLNDFINS